jgi:hypothetical protein
MVIISFNLLRKSAEQFRTGRSGSFAKRANLCMEELIGNRTRGQAFDSNRATATIGV